MAAANTDDTSDRQIDDQTQPTRARLRSNSYDQAISGDQSESKPKTPPTAESLPKKPPEDDIYMIKWIEFNRERLPILLQNMNGPCPLLAIANILLLRKQIRLNPNVGAISTENVIAAIAEYILQMDLTKFSNEARANYEHNVEDALSILPKLKTGIDVNLKFTGVDKFEYTRECIIFDLFNIQLYHGWVLDPQNHELLEIVSANGSSYNQLVEKLINQKQSDLANLARESILIEQFLEDSRSQLTHYGILQLNETMRDNQLAVLFRNNHFSTIWKNKRQLLILVSDQGYMDHPSIVFETLTDTDNDSMFTDGYGQTWKRSPPPDSSRDRDLAISIRNEEERQYREEQLRRQHSQGYHSNKDARKSKQRHRKRGYDDYDDGSCILS